MSDDSSFEQDVMNELGDDGLRQLAQQLGTDAAGAQQVVESAASGLADGLPPDAVASEAAAPPQDAPLQGVATLGGLGGAVGGGLMAGVLAKATKPVATAVAKKTGLPVATVTRGLELLVPVVLAVLSKRAASGKGPK
ncbi:DUF937 domain-containing protein [Streptomyces sp. BPTC-684]|uniref:DUF937 domain-containing protein n=1 Tax=Streptomyces sp. BPTC-684 TaxID=3043734 RepID=UPI0024B0B1A8|nr:DUF937 domain-containing protein [Streptomyces sp. BPTC-684]WHM38662.1 DUF937 domain-containing protein [Streptomyces sp. BPTC-684]